MMLRIWIACVLLALAIGKPDRVTAQDAVLFVTDLSGSMWDQSLAPIPARYVLTQAMLEAYFFSMQGAATPPSVGLISFGNKDDPIPANRAQCQLDVELKIAADTPFGSGPQPVLDALKKLRPKGFTPINAAIDKAMEHALDLVDREKVGKVRIVVVTDLKDKCDAAGPRDLSSTADYCDLGTSIKDQIENRIGERVDPADSGPIFSLEFVVAIGSNAENIARLAECAEAKPLSVTDQQTAAVVGQTIARAHGDAISEPPATVSLRLDVERIGPPDAFDRATPLGAATLQVEDGTQIREFQFVTQITGTRNAKARVTLIPQFGLSDAPQDVVFTDSAARLTWRLPQLRVRLLNQDNSAAAGVVLVRTAGEKAISRAVQGETALALLPGTYQIVAGWADGGWQSHAVTVNRTVPLAQLDATRPRPELIASWSETAFPVPLTANIVAAGTVLTTLAPGTSRTASPPITEPASLHIMRAGDPVWTANPSLPARAGGSLDLTGGAVWVTASSNSTASWKLDDLSDSRANTMLYSGSDFIRPLVPGTYRLSVDGENVCGEGRRFRVEIGRPIAFGNGPGWRDEVCFDSGN